MKKLLLSLLLTPALLMGHGLDESPEHVGYNRLDARYCIHYGPQCGPQCDSQESPHEITEYFSFSCPHCIRLFLDDFSSIEADHIQTGQVRWTFHPIPVDLLTVQAMACLEQLSEEEKQIFLEEIFIEAVKSRPGSRPLDLPLLMEKIVEATGKPAPSLTDFSALENTDAFQAAFLFVKEGIDIVGVPTLSLDGHHLGDELPTKGFVQELTSAITPTPKAAPCASS